MLSDAVINNHLFKRPYHSRFELVNNALHLLAIHDDCTAEHSCRVEKLAVQFALRLNLLPQVIEQVSTAAFLHDIGKLKIPKRILTKPGKLTKPEFETIKKHPEHGLQILEGLSQPNDIVKAVFYHHEKFDGTGYPRGIAGNDIPLLAQILSITDVYEAITADRIYRKAMSKKQAFEVISKGINTRFAPTLAYAFLELIGDAER